MIEATGWTFDVFDAQPAHRTDLLLKMLEVKDEALREIARQRAKERP